MITNQFNQLSTLLKTITIEASTNCNYTQSVDLADYFEASDFANVTDFDGVRELINNNRMLDGEIIYYSDANAYIVNDDSTMMHGFNLAHEQGYSLRELDSCKIANLLISEELQEQFQALESEINEILKPLD